MLPCTICMLQAYTVDGGVILLDCLSSRDLCSLSSELLRSLCRRGFSSSALICFNQLSWTCSALQLLLNSESHQGKNYIPTPKLAHCRVWEPIKDEQTYFSFYRSKALSDKGISHVSVCQRANHHQLPMHDIIDLAFFKLYTFLSMSKFIRTESSQITAVLQKPPTLNSAQIKLHARRRKLYVLCFSG